MGKEFELFCPNCGTPATKEGNRIICTVCDAVFEIKKTGAATVKRLGRFEEIEARLERQGKLLESLLPGDDEPDEPEDQPDGDNNEDEEESILG